MAEDVKKYIDHSNLKKVTLVGQSMGGKVALTLASKYPHLIDGLVSLDSPPVDRNPYPHLNIATQTLVQHSMFKLLR